MAIADRSLRRILPVMALTMLAMPECSYKAMPRIRSRRGHKYERGNHAPIRSSNNGPRIVGIARNQPCPCGSGVKAKKCKCPAPSARAAGESEVR